MGKIAAKAISATTMAGSGNRGANLFSPNACCEELMDAEKE
jgi:hypothetical protein